ncbi:MAG: aldo/keto reductase [Acidimicrobiales bacterium]
MDATPPGEEPPEHEPEPDLTDAEPEDGVADQSDDNLVDAGDRDIGVFLIAPLAFGCWRFTHDDPARAQEVLEAALDAGIDLVDTADAYGIDWGGAGFGAAEELLGTVLRQAPELRDRMLLATKGGIRPPVPYDSSGPGIRQACEDSLRRLGVDHIDLYQIHRPDLFTHPSELAMGLGKLRDEGKVGEVGVCNHRPDQHLALQAHLSFDLVSTQPELSVAHLDPFHDGTLDLALREGVTVLAWSPLAGGRVASGEGLRPELVTVLDELAEREEVDRAAVAIAFLLAHPSGPVPILGSQSPERIVAGSRALSVHLDRADCYRILQVAEGAPLP